MKGSSIARVVRKTLKGVVLVVALVALAVLGWVVYTQRERIARETQSAETIANGQGRWVAVGGVSVYVRTWGRDTDPVVVLVHGTGAWSGTWFDVPTTLVAHGWQVVAIDLPPFGLTRAASDGSVDYRRDAQATRILAVIATLHRPVTLLGHSFGAGPSLQAALRGGDDIARLVLVDPALGLGPAGEPPRCTDVPLVDALLSHRPVRTALVGATATHPGLTGTMLRSFVHRKERIDETLLPAYRIPFARRGFSADLGDWAATFAHAACEGAASLDVEQLRAWSSGRPPVRMIWGAEDDITPLAQGAALQGWLARSTLDVIPGVGHIPHIEDPRAFDDVLLRVLGPL